MVVLKEFWGKGVGSKLMRYLINWATKNKNIRKINLHTRKGNNRAIKLYEKFGFKKEGESSRFQLIKNKFYSSILMGLELD